MRYTARRTRPIMRKISYATGLLAIAILGVPLAGAIALTTAELLWYYKVMR